MPEIARETRPEIEDEIFLRKLKRSPNDADSQSIATYSSTRSTKLISNKLVISVANDPKKPSNDPVIVCEWGTDCRGSTYRGKRYDGGKPKEMVNIKNVILYISNYMKLTKFLDKNSSCYL